LKNVGEKSFKRLSYFVLSAVLIISAVLAFQLPNTSLDYNFEDFFPVEDKESQFFYEHRALFESDNDFILVAVQNGGSVFDSIFLSKVKRYTEELRELPYVKFVRDITHEKEQFIYSGGMQGSRPYINFKSFNLKRDSIQIYENKELVNSLINKQGDAISIFIKHKDLLSKEKSDEIVEALQTVSAEYDFERVRFAGRTIGQLFYIDTMTKEMSFYVGLSMILVVVFLLIAFRSVWGLLVPQVVVVGSMIWIVGFMALIDEPINIILIILPSIMFVVSMSDVIHLVSKYFELIREGHPKFEAIKVSMKEIGMATFLTSVTTSIGFFSLVFVNVKPIQSFGIFVGIGVLMAFVITFCTLPFLFYHTKVPQVAKRKDRNFWRPIMERSFLFTMKNRKWLPWLGIAVVGVFTYGATLIIPNNFIMDDMDPETTIKQDFDYFDNKFGGIRPFELSIKLKDSSTSSIWNKEVLHEIEKVEQYLVENYGVDIKNSLVQSVRVLNRASSAGNTSEFKVPNSKRKIRNFKRMLKVADQGKYLNTILDSTETITRVSGTIPDWGNIKTTAENKNFKTFISESIDTSLLDINLTGSAHLLDKNMSYMSSSLVQGLSFAILAVALLMGLLYKSMRMLIISIIPNIIPLVIIAGVMGFAGINLKITTAIVFTISFGIAIDDTIHFLSKFKLELNKGKSKLYALKRTYISTGKAIVLTSAILISGFLLLLLSNFMGTFYMGLMICITLLVAVLADLFILPLLLIYFYNPKKKS
jgi:predicted RND superfamily exporter protein